MFGHEKSTDLSDIIAGYGPDPMMSNDVSYVLWIYQCFVLPMYRWSAGKIYAVKPHSPDLKRSISD